MSHPEKLFFENYFAGIGYIHYFHRLSGLYSIVLKSILFLTLSILILFSACNYVENKQPVSTPQFDAIISKAERLSDAGNIKEAFDLVVSAHKAVKHLTVQDEMNYFTYVSSVYRRNFNDIDNYIASADSMIAILDKQGHIPGFSDKYYVLAYNMKAEGMSSSGLYIESYEYYYKSKTLAQRNADSCSLSYFTYNLAMVLYRQQKYDEAARQFLQSFNESRYCPDKFSHFYHNQELLDNIGLSYSGAQKHDSALWFYKKAISYIDSNYMRYAKSENVYITAKAVVYGNMGNAYMAMHQYDTATKLLKKSIAINLQKGYTNEDALLDQVKLATLYYNTGQIENMKELLIDIKAELDSIPNKSVELSWNKLMWNYYDHEHDSVKAYRYARAFVIQNDSFLAHNKVLMTSDISGRIRSLERQNHINLLKKDNEQERLYLIIAILVAVMALTIVVVVMKNAKKTRKNLAKLTDLNNKVKEQNERLELALGALEDKDKDKSRILRSVAHDVMNPIAAISALSDILSSEADNYSDEHREMLELIKEACSNSLSLSKDILEASMTMDPSSMEKEWIDINRLVRDSVRLLSIQATAKQQSITVVAHNED
ncbi:MAG: tetratricopeptide repeat protein, partial [Flavipsychrobacter sp.]|nr:tetratricopeptide repeat protein [Flavipsychrobacter sp.]